MKWRTERVGGAVQDSIERLLVALILLGTLHPLYCTVLYCAVLCCTSYSLVHKSCIVICTVQHSEFLLKLRH